MNFLLENGVENPAAHKAEGLSSRAMLETLSSVKYFITKQDVKSNVPFGFKKIKSVTMEHTEEGEEPIIYDIYENQYALSLGYTYGSYINRDEYDQLPMEKKQQAMLQGAVVDLEELTLPETTLSFTDQKVAYSFTNDEEKIVIEGNKISVKEKGATIYLNFDELSNGELYVKLNNLKFESRSKASYYSEEYLENYSTLELNRLKENEWNWESSTSSKIKLKSGKTTKNFTLYTQEHAWYTGKHDFYIPVNTNGKPKTQVSITFEKIGDYSFDSIELIHQPMEEYKENVTRLKEEELKNIKIEENKITGTITTSSNKILCLTVPFSDGWKAYVDGKEQELFQVNTGYSGVFLEKGTHNITLVYQTPLLKQGMILSVCGIFVFLLIVFGNKWVHRKKNQKNNSHIEI